MIVRFDHVKNEISIREYFRLYGRQKILFTDNLNLFKCFSRQHFEIRLVIWILSIFRKLRIHSKAIMSSKYKFEKKAIEAYSRKDFENAVYWYSRAISLSPDDADLYSERGVAYFHRKMLKESLEDMNKARELEPEKPYRYSSRAYIRDSMGDTPGAIEDYKIAIKLDPEDSVAHNNLGLLEEKLGHMAQAKAMFDLADALAKDASGSNDPADYRPKNIQREIEDERSEKTLRSEMVNVFRSKEGFREFLSFIRNGLK